MWIDMKLDMKKLLLLAILILPFLFSGAFASSTIIDNPSFENVYSNLSRTFPSDWYVGSVLSPYVLDSIQLEFLDGNALDGFVITGGSQYDGSYSLASVFDPSNYNASYSQNSISIYARQDLVRAYDSHFLVSGYHYFNYSSNITGFDAYSQLRIDPLLSISFAIGTYPYNASIHDWTYFEVEYNNGVCNVNSGSEIAKCSVISSSPSSQIWFYTSANYDQLQILGNETLTFALDDLELIDLSPLETMEEYYTEYTQSKTGLERTSGTYFNPTSTCTKIYSGKIDTNMKTRYLHFFFDDCLLYFSDQGAYSTTITELGLKAISYWNGSVWISDTTFNNFEANLLSNSYSDGSFSCYLGLSSGEFFREIGDPNGSGYKARDIDLELILPINATQLRVEMYYATGKGYSACSGTLDGEITFETNLSNILEYADSNIDVSLANPNVPTYFPVLTQYVDQNVKNLTAYQLHLSAWKNIAFNFNTYWKSSLIDTYSTGTIYNKSYVDHTYDSSGWGILSNDPIAYNTTTNFEYFGITYKPSSLYLFDSFSGGLCDDYCYSGSLFEGEYTSGYCSYIETGCHSSCLPSSLDIIEEDIGVTSASFNWTQLDSHDWELRSSNGTTLTSGTTILRSIDFEGLTAETDYIFYVEGDYRSGCYVGLDDYVEFTTLNNDYPDSPYSDIIEAFGDSINTFINLGVSGFATTMGITSVSAKSMLWLIISIAVTIGIVVFVISKSNGSQIDLSIILLVVMLVMLAIGWVLGWLDIFWMVLLGIAIGLILLFKFQSMGSL